MNQMDRGEIGNALSVGVKRSVVDLFLVLVEEDRFSLDELRRELRTSSAVELTETQVISVIDGFLVSGGLI